MFSKTWFSATVLGLAIALAAPVAGMAKDRDDCNSGVSYNRAYTSSYRDGASERVSLNSRNDGFRDSTNGRTRISQTDFNRHNQMEPARSYGGTTSFNRQGNNYAGQPGTAYSNGTNRQHSSGGGNFTNR